MDEVHAWTGVDAHEPGPAVGARRPPLADGHPGRPGPVQHGALAQVGRGLAQVVEMRDGDVRQAHVARVAVHLELAPHHLARGRAGHLPERRVRLREPADVGDRVAALERPPRRAAAPVHDLPRLQELPHQSRQLRPGQAGGLAQEALHQPPVRLAEVRVVEPRQRPRHEGVGLVARNGIEVHGPAAVQKRANLLRGAKSFDV